jgi:hypothetical protein
MRIHLLLSHRRRPERPSSLVVASAVLVGLVLALAGCGTTAATATTGPTSTTPATTPTPLTTVAPAQVAQACDSPAHPAPVPDPAVLVGGLYVGALANLGNLTYPKAHLPEGTPLKPLQVADEIPHLPSDAPTNPYLSEAGGYVLVVCNGSDQPHTIQGVAIRLDTLTPYVGQLNEWSFCAGAYSRAFGAGGSGCGGGPAEDEYVHGAFAPDAPTGTVVSTTQSVVIHIQRYGTLPWTLQHGETLLIDVGIVPPTAPGYYTFAFGIAIDGAAPVFAPVSPVTLLAPVAHEWSGSACLAPAMQSQIPPVVQPPTYYLCPASS